MRRSRFAPRSGLTLVEVLVVVSVIGVLAALLLPAVQASREASRRTECLNHLKQVGLALNSYVATNGYFPAVNSHTADSPVPFPSYNLPSAHAYSPLARMLAELEQPALFNASNFTSAATSPDALWANLTVMSLTVSLFLCPSDPAHSPPGYGRVNYRFNLGPSPWDSPGKNIPGVWDGAFTVHNFYRPADFTDGLSQTVGASERLQGGWIKDVFTRGDYYLTSAYWNSGQTPPYLGPEWAVAICSSVPADTPIETRSGESWFLSGNHFTNYNHCATPNARLTDCSLFPVNEGIHWRTLHSGVFTARSRHPGGVNVLRMDGSITFVTDSVQLAVWRALSTRNGGEVIPDTY